MNEEKLDKKNMIITSICLPREMQDRIKREAKWRGKSRSEFIRDDIQAYCRALDKQGKAPTM